MTNSIDNIGSNIINQAQTPNTGALENRKNTTAGNNAPSTGKDTISLTDSAKLLNKLEKSIESVPVVNSEKVDRIRENLNSGNYTVNPQIVAKKFSMFEAILSNAS